MRAEGDPAADQRRQRPDQRLPWRPRRPSPCHRA